MPQVIADERPKARKEHRCSLCSRTIRVGEVYRRCRMVWDDGPYVFRECAHCHALLARREHGLDDALDWADDGYTDETIWDWEPTTVAGLRQKVHFRRRWTRRDGSLYPVPGSSCIPPVKD